ncbi:MAG: hypothetical protein RR275_01925 [Lachnospiraceae bacterium]
MHVNGKVMAFAGLSLAVTVVLISMSGVLPLNTLFLLGAASFVVGIIIREFGLRIGSAFYVASILLSFILAPHKMYCITFAAMGFYIVMMELAWKLLKKKAVKGNKRYLFWLCKYGVFNIIYIPLLLFFPKLLFANGLSPLWMICAMVGGQIVLLIYDWAYEYFQIHIWGKFRKYL